MSIQYCKSDKNFISLVTKIPVANTTLSAEVNIPAPPKGIVIFPQLKISPFSHSTLVNSLLTSSYGIVMVNLVNHMEKIEGGFSVFTDRLIEVARWVKKVFVHENINLAFYADCEAAATAIKASIFLDNSIKAIICKDGHTDLIFNDLENVVAPTLLMVDELNVELLRMNKAAVGIIHSDEKLIIVHNEETNPKGDFTSLELKESFDWVDKYVSRKELVLA
jgi:hypothetical protein